MQPSPPGSRLPIQRVICCVLTCVSAGLVRVPQTPHQLALRRCQHVLLLLPLHLLLLKLLAFVPA